MHSATSASEREDSKVSPFQLQSKSETFSSKSNDVFAALTQLEAKHSAVVKARSRSQSSEDDDGLIKDDPEENEDSKQSIVDARPRGRHSRDSRQRPIPDTNSHRNRSHRDGNHRGDSRSSGSDSDRNRRNRGGDFRRPTHRPPRGRRHYVPDFKLHPERWTHYSLNDISEDDMSDRSNTRAALAFLEERRKEREKQERIAAGLPADEPRFDVSYGACSQGRISFSKPKDKVKDDNDVKKESLEVKSASQSHSSVAGDKLKYSDNDVGDDDGSGQESVSENRERKGGNGLTNSFKLKKRMNRQIRKREMSDEESEDN